MNNFVSISGNLGKVFTRFVNGRDGKTSVTNVSVLVPKCGFVDVTLWGLSDRVIAALNKVSQSNGGVTVIGRLKKDSWKDKKTGQDRNKLSVVANEILFSLEEEKQEQPKSVNTDFTADIEDTDLPF